MARFFSHLRLGTRLMAGFLSLVLLGAGVAAVGIHALGRLNDQTQVLYDKELLGISAVKEANINLIYVGRARARLALAANEQEWNQASRSLSQALQDFDHWLSEARPRFYTPPGRALLAQVDGLANDWRRATQAYLAVATPERMRQRDPALVPLDGAVMQANRVLDERLTELTRMKEKQGQEAAQDGQAMYQSASLMMVVLTS